MVLDESIEIWIPLEYQCLLILKEENQMGYLKRI